MELTAKVCCKNAVFAVVFSVKMLSHSCAHSKWYTDLASTHPLRPPPPHAHMDIQTDTYLTNGHTVLIHMHTHTACVRAHAHAHNCSGKKMIISLFIFYHVVPRRMCYCCQSIASYLHVHVGSSMVLS